MTRRLLPGCLLIATLATLTTALAQEEALKSGPQVGQLIPASFHPFNVNGEKGKDRYHCLVCEYGINPVVLIFARERADGGDEMLLKLLKRVDDTIAKDQDQILRSFVVFLSSAAHSSVTDSKNVDPDKLVTEARERDILMERVQERAAMLKHVVVTTYPLEGPKGYELSDKAEVTVVLYLRHKVIANYTFAAEKLTDADVERIMERVSMLVGTGARILDRPKIKKKPPVG